MIPVNLRRCKPVRIRARIEEAIEWGGPSDETGKTEALWHSICSTIKIPRRFLAIEWGGPSVETGKKEVPCYDRCGTIKIIGVQVQFVLTTASLSLYMNRSSTSPRVSLKATKWGGPSDETGKTEATCHSRCDTIKIPPCSKTLSAEHSPKFCSSSSAMVTSPYKWKILERDVKQ
jgi:hypothetical protein